MHDKDEDVRILAEAHYSVEPGITEIFRIIVGNEQESLPDEPIKLLEVNRNTIAVGIMPLGFSPAPDHGIHSSSVIVEVTPEEFDRIRSRQLPLPGDWVIGDLVPRPVPVTHQ